jgi:RNA polymerase sigma-70 factor (ECF subfamily)
MAIEMIEILERAKAEAWSDEEVVRRLRAGETALYEILMRRYNQRLYRVARAILRDDGEAEDVMQDAYVRAYQHLDQYAGRAPFSTWLTRIAVHEALARLRVRNRKQSLDQSPDDGDFTMSLTDISLNPEQSLSNAETGRLLEEAILSLPDHYRTVLMLRDVEELSTAETAETLGLTEPNVKARLHRGRALVWKWLFARVGGNAEAAFPFMGVRCDRVVRLVFAHLEA